MKKNLFVVVIIVIIIIAGGVYYWTMAKPSSPVGTPAPTDLKIILEKLGTHIILPTGEDPQIGKIDDPLQAVKAQPFVMGAQKGDLLIVYVKAAKAIVYSPARDLIVNVGPVSTNPDQTAVSPAGESTSAPAKR